MNPFDLVNPVKMMNPFSSDQMQEINSAKKKLENMKLMEKLYDYFKVTNSGILQRLGLLLFPFKNFQQRSEQINIDLYLPMMGQLLYTVISSYISSFSQTTFNPVMLSRLLGFSIILLIIQVAVAYVLSKGAGDYKLLDIIALSGYNFVYAAVILPFRFISYFYYIVLAYAIVATSMHQILYGIMKVRQNAELNLSSTAQINGQNVVVIIMGAVQGGILLLLAWIG